MKNNKNNNEEFYKIPKIFDEMVLKNKKHYFMEIIIIIIRICTIPFNNPTRPLVESRGTGSSANNPTAKTPTSQVKFMVKRLKCVQFLFKITSLLTPNSCDSMHRSSTLSEHKRRMKGILIY